MTESPLTLYVHYQHQLVGTLHWNAERLVFRYASEWLDDAASFPISLSLPLSGEFSETDSHAFFVNLLPEASVRQRICAALKISPGNDFELLRAIGGDCAGALTISETAASPQRSVEYEPISDKQLADWSTGTPDAFSAITGQNEVRLSLAGAQDKLPVHEIDGRLVIPKGDAPSTLLIKFASPFYSHLPENETFVSLVARRLQLPVVDIGLRETAKKRIAVIQRYDRVAVESGFQRTHQEDFCQALGIDPRQKYEKEGGPSLAQCAAVIRAHCSLPIVELRRLVDWVLFNVLLGNADAHGKNISLLYTANGQRVLAPFYDLVCTRNYPKIDRHLAMSIGGRTDPDLIGIAQLEQFAEEIQVGWRQVREAAQRLVALTPQALDEAAQEFTATWGTSPVLARITNIAAKQCKRLDRELTKKG